MTLSLLACDPDTRMIGGISASGALFVGGWCLRGDPDSGMSASQGSAPSTLCGEAVLRRMREHEDAVTALGAVMTADDGRDHRQLAALDKTGRGAACTGALTPGECGHRQARNLIAIGCDLAGNTVLDDLLVAYRATQGPLATRLVAAIRAALHGQENDLASAALLVVGRDTPPLSLRIDGQADPLAALAVLEHRARTDRHATWTRSWPTLGQPFRVPSAADLMDRVEDLSDDPDAD